jgi:hypothetical protein
MRAALNFRNLQPISAAAVAATEAHAFVIALKGLPGTSAAAVAFAVWRLPLQVKDR